MGIVYSVHNLTSNQGHAMGLMFRTVSSSLLRAYMHVKDEIHMYTYA